MNVRERNKKNSDTKKKNNNNIKFKKTDQIQTQPVLVGIRLVTPKSFCGIYCYFVNSVKAKRGRHRKDY